LDQNEIKILEFYRIFSVEVRSFYLCSLTYLCLAAVSSQLILAMSSTILLVDDDVDDLEIYRHLLGAANSDIVAHSFLSPVEALEYLATASRLPDQVILDFNMPEMNGLDFLKMVRGNTSLAALPVTVVTTSCNPRDVKELMLLGAECHLKPSGLGDFGTLIEGLIKRK
jgi:CheY-like chemotaxis protein